MLGAKYTLTAVDAAGWLKSWFLQDAQDILFRSYTFIFVPVPSYIKLSEKCLPFLLFCILFLLSDPLRPGQEPDAALQCDGPWGRPASDWNLHHQPDLGPTVCHQAFGQRAHFQLPCKTLQSSGQEQKIFCFNPGRRIFCLNQRWSCLAIPQLTVTMGV